MKRYKIIAKAISPIHIGSGDVYEPINFVIDDKYLYFFKEEKFYKNLNDEDKKKFLSLTSKIGIEALISLWRFIHEKRELAKKVSYYKIQVSSGLKRHYEGKLIKANVDNNLRNEFNQFIIEKAVRGANNYSLYIPGSSIKGSIETAIRELDNDKKQYIRISDSYVITKREMIGYGLNKEKYESDMSGPQKFIEVIFKDAFFEFDIRIDEDKVYAFKDMIREINNHYFNIFKSMFEIDEIKRVLGKKFKEEYSDFNLKENQFLLRVGKHSGATSVTKNNRQIKVKMAEVKGRSIDEKLNKLLKKAKKEPDILEDFIIEDNKLTPQKRKEQNVFKDYYFFDKYALERDIRELKIKSINGYLDRETTMWFFGFEKELKEDGVLPFGWLLCEIKENE